MKKKFVKAYVKEVKEDGRIITGAIASTDSADRDGEILSSKGWNLDSFQKNPVLLWGHNSHELPIGKIINIKSTEGRLLFDAEFAVKENPFAEKVSKLMNGGFLNTFSVGFLPQEKEGDTFTKQELLEISVVNVPANPEAVVSRELKSLWKEVKDVGEKKVEKKIIKKVKKKVEEKEPEKKVVKKVIPLKEKDIEKTIELKEQDRILLRNVLSSIKELDVIKNNTSEALIKKTELPKGNKKVEQALNADKDKIHKALKLILRSVEYAIIVTKNKK